MTYLEYCIWLDMLENCEIEESCDEEGNYQLIISGEFEIK